MPSPYGAMHHQYLYLTYITLPRRAYKNQEGIDGLIKCTHMAFIVGAFSMQGKGMMNRPPAKKHLTEDDRTRIETLLNEQMSIRYIAERLDKSPSTISREIKLHTADSKTCSCDCIYFYECKNMNVCGSKSCKKQCRNCGKAKKYCTDYSKSYCDRLEDSKLKLCNGCTRPYNCHFSKRYYKASKAQREYKDTLVNSRNGYDLTAEELIAIDETVSPLIKNGQSVYHIAQTNDLKVSESTLRRMINSCELEARNIDLRNAVKRRKRQKRPKDYKTMKVIKDGHKYEDYLKFIESNPIEIPQMDCVEGSKDSKAVLLTLFFPVTRLQLAFILEEQTSENVVACLDMLEEILGPELFKEMIPYIITDNGHEFADIDGMQRSINGGNRCFIYFCEPNHPEQKGGCEKNHEFIRYVIKKGTSIEPYSQADINLMMDHINSYKRKELHGKSPHELAKLMYPEDFVNLLGLEEIAPNDIILTPKLLKKSDSSD